jgi:hypothetical protein
MFKETFDALKIELNQMSMGGVTVTEMTAKNHMIEEQ